MTTRDDAPGGSGEQRWHVQCPCGCRYETMSPRPDRCGACGSRERHTRRSHSLTARKPNPRGPRITPANLEETDHA